MTARSDVVVLLARGSLARSRLALSAPRESFESRSCANSVGSSRPFELAAAWGRVLLPLPSFAGLSSPTPTAVTWAPYCPPSPLLSGGGVFVLGWGLVESVSAAVVATYSSRQRWKCLSIQEPN